MLSRARFGQNFLVDRSAVERIVSLLDPRPGEAVLEIGPGRGALTEALVTRAGRIAVVEIDRDLARLLESRFSSALVLLEGDVLEIDLARVAAALGAPEAPLVIAGNLPFNISKPVASKLVRERARVGRAVLMFQREVADRLTALPGTRAYGPLTVLVGQAFGVRRLFDLSPSAFRPRPKVVSSLTSWTPRAAHAFSAEDEDRLRACLRASFAHRRQTLLRNLRAVVPGGEEEALRLLRAAAIEPSLRAEAVPPEAFRRLAALWPRV